MTNLNGGGNMDKPINVYAQTDCYDYNGDLDSIIGGYGYKDTDGNITWYDGYSVVCDEFHSTTIYPADENGKITSIFPIERLQHIKE